jgi:hypothetical protein
MVIHFAREYNKPSSQSHYRSMLHSARTPLVVMQKLRTIAPKYWFIVALLVTFGAIATVGYSNLAKEKKPTAGDRLKQISPVVIWAWERPEKLDFIDPAQVTVAFLAQTIYLRDDRIEVRPRLQPLKVADAPLMAVVRIESERGAQPTLSASQASAAVRSIVAATRLPRVAAVQIDFDARLSEREFYRTLLVDLRKELPNTIGLSITALASWCTGDPWIEDLPVDEAVPMLFRMGVDGPGMRARLAAGEPFSASKCQTSAGLSIDEPLERVPAVSRLYIFNPKSWSPAAVEDVVRKL